MCSKTQTFIQFHLHSFTLHFLLFWGLFWSEKEKEENNFLLACFFLFLLFCFFFFCAKALLEHPKRSTPGGDVLMRYLSPEIRQSFLFLFRRSDVSFKSRLNSPIDWLLFENVAQNLGQICCRQTIHYRHPPAPIAPPSNPLPDFPLPDVSCQRKTDAESLWLPTLT